MQFPKLLIPHSDTPRPTTTFSFTQTDTQYKKAISGSVFGIPGDLTCNKVSDFCIFHKYFWVLNSPKIIQTLVFCSMDEKKKLKKKKNRSAWRGGRENEQRTVFLHFAEWAEGEPRVSEVVQALLIQCICNHSLSEWKHFFFPHCRTFAKSIKYARPAKAIWHGRGKLSLCCSECSAHFAKLTHALRSADRANAKRYTGWGISTEEQDGSGRHASVGVGGVALQLTGETWHL